jgi:hypothetical protein
MIVHFLKKVYRAKYYGTMWNLSHELQNVSKCHRLDAMLTLIMKNIKIKIMSRIHGNVRTKC